MKHAFTYHWKLWTIPEVLEMLQEAGFAEVHVWMRCMLVSQAFTILCQVHVTCLLLQPFPVHPQLVRSCLWLWVYAYAGLGCLNKIPWPAHCFILVCWLFRCTGAGICCLNKPSDTAVSATLL